MASIPRARGEETLRYFADLQRQVADRVAPLRTRQRQRRQRQLRRLVVRTLAMLLPLVLVALLALDVGGGRTWLDHRWQDLSRSSQQPPQGQAPGY